MSDHMNTSAELRVAARIVAIVAVAVVVVGLRLAWGG